MFLDGIEQVAFQEPWQQPLGDRIVALRRRSATMRIAYLYEAPDTSTFRYRVYNMIQVLDPGHGDIAAAWFTEAEIDQVIPLLPMIDALVICRARYSHSLNRLISRARNLNCPTIFDCDDLIFDTEYTHLILNTLDQALYGAAWDHWYACIGRIGATAKLCDRAIVTNSYLANKYRQFALARRADCDVRVIPNFLNREQIGVSDRIYHAKQAGGWRRSEQIHIGYFSGTPTHNKDFAVVAGALSRLFARDSRLVLRLVGFMQPSAELAAFRDRIERYELQDFINLQLLIGGTDFNLIPLQDNAFTNCKSELKYFESAIVGTVSLASPTHVYRQCIDDGVTGFIVNSTDWEAKLAAAIDNRDAYPAMANAARRQAEAAYSYKNMLPTILAALFEPRPDVTQAAIARVEYPFVATER